MQIVPTTMIKDQCHSLNSIYVVPEWIIRLVIRFCLAPGYRSSEGLAQFYLFCLDRKSVASGAQLSPLQPPKYGNPSQWPTSFAVIPWGNESQTTFWRTTSLIYIVGFFLYSQKKCCITRSDFAIIVLHPNCGNPSQWKTKTNHILERNSPYLQLEKSCIGGTAVVIVAPSTMGTLPSGRHSLQSPRGATKVRQHFGELFLYFI